MLSSRPAQASSEDVRDLVADNGATINIIDNTVVDPPLFSLTLDLADGKQVPLLLHRADEKITLFDLIRVFQTLGYNSNYQEIR